MLLFQRTPFKIVVISYNKKVFKGKQRGELKKYLFGTKTSPRNPRKRNHWKLLGYNFYLEPLFPNNDPVPVKLEV